MSAEKFFCGESSIFLLVLWALSAAELVFLGLFTRVLA